MTPAVETEVKDVAHIDVLLRLFQTDFNGINNAVKTNRLIGALAKSGIAMKPQSLRYLLGHIRQNDLLSPGFILSDVNEGYWLSYDDTEMSEWLDKQMNRMSNQFSNIKQLHQRIRYNKKAGNNFQPSLF